MYSSGELRPCQVGWFSIDSLLVGESPPLSGGGCPCREHMICRPGDPTRNGWMAAGFMPDPACANLLRWLLLQADKGAVTAPYTYAADP